MSVKKKVLSVPGYELDPATGKCFAVPYNVLGGHQKRPNTEWNHLEKIDSAGSKTQPFKMRKTETGVRKELFKFPLKTQVRLKDSGTNIKERQLIITCKNIPKKEPKMEQAKPSEHFQKKTLLPITETNKYLGEQKGFPFKSPGTPNIKFTPATPKNDLRIPDFLDSNADFLHLEKMCQQSPMNESPVSSVCNLFENNMLLKSVKKTLKESGSPRDILDEINRILAKDRKEFEESKRKIQDCLDEMQTRQDENQSNILTLVNRLTNDVIQVDEKSTYTDADKENSTVKRRSLRLLNKNPTTPEPAGSPVILKAGDLRKSTLTKSLVFKCKKYQIDSPRIQKAIDMYNSTRSACPALLTPKISRNQLIESSRSSNLRSNLSVKVQQQCYMLQDTPIHK